MMTGDMTTRALRAAAAAICVLAASGCDWLDDRLQTCGYMRVDLTNSEQSIDPVSVLTEAEKPFPEAVLASGSSRRLEMCVERGDAKRFRAMRRDETLATANCVVSRHRYEYETTVARVVWDPRGLVCENW
jgi:hypothetical protein